MPALNCYRLLVHLTGLILLCASLQLTATPLEDARVQHLDSSHEELLIEALDHIAAGDIDSALDRLGIIVKAYPNYRLAQLVYADLLLAKSHPIREFGNFQSAPYAQISALLDEARSRWRYHHTPPPAEQMIPASMVKLSENQKFAIVVDMQASRLYLYKNNEGVPELVYDFYATIGKNGTRKYTEGDQKTPTGVYFVTGFIDPEKLPDFYGSGAFPIDYPNAWDKRHGRTGSGIWLHGTPSYTLNRPPRDSDGCVILSNGNLETIAPYLSGDTPVVLTESIEWLDKREWQKRQDNYASLVEQWRKDWESRDAGLYLSHYSPEYAGLGMDYKGWVDYKKRINPSSKFIKVGITEKSIFLYPGERDLIVVTFRQQFRSDNQKRDFVKRQYWRMEKDGRWRIVYEGSVS
jgi:murein L,D-transpeptidase YafK